MQCNLRPWTTAGIAIVGTSLVAVTPVAPPPSNVQHRSIQLVDYVEYDASQLASATEANWSGLESVLSSSNWTTDPDISQGLSTLFSDLSSGTANPVTSPVSLLSEFGLLLTSSGDAFSAASTALKGVTDNIESALSSDNYSAALTDLENGPTTVLYSFLNGYPETVGSGGVITSELGLLTNTDNGASTGTIDALAQVSNTVADQVSALGGGDLTTGSLPLVTGNLDLSISVGQILSDLGLGSAGSLTINGLLTDLGLSPTGDLIPSLTIGDVLGYLGLSGSSGLTPDQILADLGIGSITDGVYSDPGLSLDSILADLGIGSITDGVYSDPGLSLDSILGDLGINTSSSLSLDSILGDLGIGTTGTLSVSNILSDLGINTSSSIGLESILSDLGISTSGTFTIPISLDTIISDAGISGFTLSTIKSLLGSAGSYEPSISVSSLLGDLGLNGSYSLDTILSDLGLNGSFSISTILGDLGLGGSFSIGTILSDLGINGTSTLDINSILSDLGLSGTGTLDINSILSDLGLSGTASINISDILSAFGLSDSSTIPLPSVSIDGLLGDLGVNPDESILTLLGIPDTLSLSPTLDLTGGSVPTFDLDLAQDLLAALGNFSALSADLPSLLTNDPTLDLTSLLSGLLTDLDLPGAITGGTLSVDLTNVVADLLPSLVP